MAAFLYTLGARLLTEVSRVNSCFYDRITSIIVGLVLMKDKQLRLDLNYSDLDINRFDHEVNRDRTFGRMHTFQQRGKRVCKDLLTPNLNTVSALTKTPLDEIYKL